jgi:hypothetical protein
MNNQNTKIENQLSLFANSKNKKVISVPKLINLGIIPQACCL